MWQSEKQGASMEEEISERRRAEEEEEEAYLFAMELAGAASVPMVLKSALDLGILDIIAKSGNGSYLSPSQIASQIPSIKNPNAPSLLDRLLRLLTSYNILSFSLCQLPHGKVERHYGLSTSAKYLLNNEDGLSVAPYFLMQHDHVLKRMWYHLTDSIKEGGLPFDNAYGMTAFEFNGTNPRFNQLFNKAMSDCSTLAMKKILETYTGFEGVGSVVDVGGGTGAVIHMIVSKHPSIKGINFDLPHVIKEAPSYPGVEHVGGDMFVSVPKGDVIFMKWLCHDWNDEQCLKILKNCYDSLPNTGKVILAESLIPETPESNLAAKCMFQMDMIMLCHSSGGRERTQKEYEALGQGSGFQGFQVACCVLGNIYVMEFLKK